MTFLETTVFITELWNESPYSNEFKKARIDASPSKTSTLVLREFQERVIAKLICLHQLLSIETQEGYVMQEIASNRLLGTMALQILNKIKVNLEGWDGEQIKLYIETMIESDAIAEFTKIAGTVSDHSKCTVINRPINKGELGNYSLDTGCRKDKCNCASIELMKKTLTPEVFQELSKSENPDVKTMLPILNSFLNSDEKIIRGKNCNKISDLLHVIEASQENCTKILTSDKAYPDLSASISGPNIHLLSVTPFVKKREKVVKVIKQIFNWPKKH